MQFFNRKTTVSLAMAIGLAVGITQTRAEEFVNILTGGTSGVYYPLGVAMEKIYSSIPDVRPSVQATKASIENINLINKATKLRALKRSSPISAPLQLFIRIMSRSSPPRNPASRRWPISRENVFP
jgi:hypothetical protein